MDESGYASLFKELGFIPTPKRTLLRHPKGLPRLYFNVARDRSAYFAVRSADYKAFSRALWSVIAPQQKKDNDPSLMTLTPRDGREREALASLIGWCSQKTS